MFTPSQGHPESFLGRKKKGREEGNERISGVEALALSHITLIKNNRGPSSCVTPMSKKGIVKASSWPRLTLGYMIMLC